MNRTWSILAAIGLGCLAEGASAQTYQRLFDGVSLKGWHQTGKGTWTVADSVLIGTMAANNPESYLISDITAKDFSLRLKFLWGKGNTGVNFRNIQQGDLANGIQSDIDGAAGTCGALYDNVKGAYVAKNDSIPKWYKANDWNDLVIDAQGTKIKVSLNGHLTVSYDDVGGRREGVFAFQLHVGLAMDIRFKDIEMLDYTKTTAVAGIPAGKAWPIRSKRVRYGRVELPDGDLGVDGKRIR